MSDSSRQCRVFNRTLSKLEQFHRPNGHEEQLAANPDPWDLAYDLWTEIQIYYGVVQALDFGFAGVQPLVRLDRSSITPRRQRYCRQMKTIFDQ